MSEDIHNRPNTFPLPPILLAVFILTGLVLGNNLPSLAIPFQTSLILKILGLGLIVSALAIDFWVFSTFKSHKTNIRPDRPAEALVTSGPFKYSRNPIYLGNVILLFGIGLLAGSGIFFVFAPINGLLLQELQIKREEAHLASRFGETWQAYKKSVRRWI